MAQNRTFQFIGIAYGDTPVSVTAEINGTTVFSGEVPTVNSPLPLPSNLDLANASPLFTLENSPLFSTDFVGSYPMTISAAGGYGIAVGTVLCNYMVPAGNATAFSCCYFNQTANTSDPRTNVVINGTAMDSTPPPTGAWLWEVPSPGNIACDLNVDLGNIA